MPFKWVDNLDQGGFPDIVNHHDAQFHLGLGKKSRKLKCCGSYKPRLGLGLEIFLLKQKVEEEEGVEETAISSAGRLSKG